jgi:serine-protein kinase ATM
MQILPHIQPVMRHYFTEKHKTPTSWFAMRLNYTRSVATTSIVGHILGLGDRHSSNILVDNGTGEVVHIDLGIAFDQASRLDVCYITILTYLIFIGQAPSRTGTSAFPND